MGRGEGGHHHPDYPKLPKELNTVTCGSNLEKWKRRRAILVAQRDIRQSHIRLTLKLQELGVPAVKAVLRSLEGAIDKLDQRLDECNEAIDDLEKNGVVLSPSQLGLAPGRRRR